MFSFECCKGNRKCRVYALADSKLYESAVIKFGRCPVCKRLFCVIEKVDYFGKKTTIKKYGLQAQILFEKNLYNMLYEVVPIKSGKSGFYLLYSEYGKIKKCYSNLRTLKLGKLPSNFEDITTDNKVLRLNEFYDKQQKICAKCS